MHQPAPASVEGTCQQLTCPIHAPPAVQLEAFYTTFAAFPKVVAKMQHWAPDAEHWAWWGRLSILDLAANTNNPLERGFGMLKYTHLNRNTQSTIQQLVDVLVGTWVAACMRQRELQLAGRTCSDQRKRVQHVDDIVAAMVSDGAVQAATGNSAPGLTVVKKAGGHSDAKACLADLSCTCNFSCKCDKCGTGSTWDSRWNLVAIHQGLHIMHA